MPAITNDRAAVLLTVSRLIREVMEDDGLLTATMTEQTSFSEDLELESIEMVALAEKLQAEFSADVDFVGWLSDKELDEIIALRVGDLVELIVSCQPSLKTA